MEITGPGVLKWLTVRLNGLPEHWLLVVCLVAIYFLFFGWRWQRSAMGTAGALGFAWPAYLVGAEVAKLLPGSKAWYVQLCVMGLLSALGGWLCARLCKVTAMVFAGVGAALVALVAVGMSPWSKFSWVAGLAGFLAGAVGSLFVKRWVPLIFGSAVGAYALAVSALTAAVRFKVLDRAESPVVIYGFWAVLTLCGVLAQIGHKPPEKKDKKAAVQEGIDARKSPA